MTNIFNINNSKNLCGKTIAKISSAKKWVKKFLRNFVNPKRYRIEL